MRKLVITLLLAICFCIPVSATVYTSAQWSYNNPSVSISFNTTPLENYIASCTSQYNPGYMGNLTIPNFSYVSWNTTGNINKSSTSVSFSFGGYVQARLNEDAADIYIRGPKTQADFNDLLNKSWNDYMLSLIGSKISASVTQSSPTYYFNGVRCSGTTLPISQNSEFRNCSFDFTTSSFGSSVPKTISTSPFSSALRIDDSVIGYKVYKWGTCYPFSTVTVGVDTNLSSYRLSAVSVGSIESLSFLPAQGPLR